MTPQEFYTLAEKVGTPTAYGIAMGNPGWGDLMEKHVPPHLQGGLARYVVHGIKTGSFLQAVILGDLFTATLRGDIKSLTALAEITYFFIRASPEACYGDAASFNEWHQRGGMFPSAEAA